MDGKFKQLEIEDEKQSELEIKDLRKDQQEFEISEKTKEEMITFYEKKLQADKVREKRDKALERLL